MAQKSPLNKIQSELQEGMGLAKCRKCGCMKDALEALQSSLLSFSQSDEFLDLLEDIERWRDQMKPIKYACLGCEYCFPAVAMNIFLFLHGFRRECNIKKHGVVRPLDVIETRRESVK